MTYSCNRRAASIVASVRNADRMDAYHRGAALVIRDILTGARVLPGCTCVSDKANARLHAELADWLAADHVAGLLDRRSTTSHSTCFADSPAMSARTG